ncbi:lipopolysaccharide export system protein LptA [Rhizomicrobium palustre]|uniref:Lipopolysaccharide export system protein LptA n=1 Tax=Rhizomicrobium palustre TaxID=189966 RepID=A0A846MTY7_9PROT|nr:lipopolysaccharide transport periplasmic protein LptA [Rhizomicrobium palustre]NIK86695.1 lipopolysaccharide export system protein LptA [Rhizomicrobium palustre]
MRGYLIAGFALAALTGAGVAQQASFGKGMLNPNAPIDISADNFTADANAKTGLYTGNVVVHQGEVALRANTMRAQFVNDKPSRINAQGKVVIDAPSGIATGDNGVYDVNPRIITLTGNVVLTKDKNVMRGRQLVVNLITGLATLDGGEGKGGRVQALFSPSSEPSDTQKP